MPAAFTLPDTTNVVNDESWHRRWDRLLTSMVHPLSIQGTGEQRIELLPAHCNLTIENWTFRELSLLGWLRYSAWGVCPR